MESTEELKQSQYDDWDSLKLTRADDIWIGKDLELWKISLKSMLNKVKSSKLEQIKGTAKLKEADQHIVDAFLIVLGYKTKEDRKQALKDFRTSKIDLLKQTKFVKFEDITFDDWKQIQRLLVDFINNNIKNVADPYKDMAKWVTNLVEMKIASCWLPRKPVLMDIESIMKRKLDGLNLDGLNLDDLDLDSLNVELLKCNETEDWSVIGYIEEHKDKPYDLEQLYDTIFEIAMWNRMISHQAFSDFWCLSLK